ncbi:hypothetical protein [Burkholderia orbicola]|uniref:hypothetical protein n=1 Tax=Burkholderia orbicola TaxID=2978683 RepID=UPI0026549A3E|nr:hypothetical protein [Burkholderia orbicola]MDN7559189.1 hypothetical protein [Burkholderia orbicola]
MTYDACRASRVARDRIACHARGRRARCLQARPALRDAPQSRRTRRDFPLVDGGNACRRAPLAVIHDIMNANRPRSASAASMLV